MELISAVKSFVASVPDQHPCSNLELRHEEIPSVQDLIKLFSLPQQNKLGRLFVPNNRAN